MATAAPAQNRAGVGVNSVHLGADGFTVTPSAAAPPAPRRSRRKSQLRLIVSDDARLLLGEQAAQDRHILRTLDAHVVRRRRASRAS